MYTKVLLSLKAQFVFVALYITYTVYGDGMFPPTATLFTPHNSIIYVLNADYPYIVLRENKRNKEKLFLIFMGKGKKPRTKDDAVIP